jgi:aspartate kinase
MKVIKFGGTSLGDAVRIKSVAEIIRSKGDSIVVCSAMAGVTNTLEAIAALWKAQKGHEVSERLGQLKKQFQQTASELGLDEQMSGPQQKDLNQLFDLISQELSREYSESVAKWLLAWGELITSDLVARYFNQNGIPVQWLNALAFMSVNKAGEPDLQAIGRDMDPLLSDTPVNVFVTQGYICRNHLGEVDNLKRGGSDYSATLIGAAIQAEVIEIWTDIDGLRNNDPRYVADTFPIRELSFEEAAELAYFGAKILHPACVWPARERAIPIWLKNTLEPQAHGTLISNYIRREGITAVAAKDQITMIRIRSGRMLNAYGFLRGVFQIFENYKTPIDVITTSEVAVSVTIDNDSQLPGILNELQALGRVEVENNLAIICVVGDVLALHQGYAAHILEALKHAEVKMISFGGSTNNITLVVPAAEKQEILNTLNRELFQIQTTQPSYV